MNILCINHEYPPIGGGGGTACRYTAREYASLGNEVTIVTAAFENTPDYEVIDEVKIHRLKCKRTAKDHSSFAEMLSFIFAALRFIPKLLKNDKVDVIHVFFGIPSGPIGWYILKRYKIPYVVSLAGGDVPGMQKRFKAVYRILNPFVKAIGRNAAFVAANSSKLLSKAKKFYGKTNYGVIPYGANIGEFPSSKSFNTGEALNIVTTARIEERKGIQYVIEALLYLVEKTNGNIHYTIIGDGVYRGSIELQIEKYGLQKYVDITGFIPYADVMEKLQKADVFVLTSHWEGMPSAVLEAMASHLPIIMSDCEGSIELVDRNGYILEMNENITVALAEKLLILYKDRALLAEMGRISYERVKEQFTWDKAAKAYLEVFNTIHN